MPSWTHVLLALVFLCLTACDEEPAENVRAGWGGATTIVTAPVELRSMIDDIEALGTARANESIDIQPRIASIVDRVAFEEGQVVQQGDLLIELENNEIVAGLALARASLSESRSIYDRSKALASSQAISASNLDQLLAQLEARAGITQPIMIHAILETAQGVKNVEEIAGASPRMHGMSLGPADLAASRGMKTTRVGGGHPHYGILADGAGNGARDSSARPFYQQDLWHYTVGKMVDACAANGIKAFYGPFGDFSDPDACEAQFRNAFLQGCLGAWSLHPSQVEIAKRVFSPDPAEVKFALRILEAMPDGTGAVMIDGKMQDDATWKQARVIADLARLVAAKEPEMAEIYGL